MDADALETLLNHNAGLTALSGGTGDMRKLQEAAAHGDHDAELAIEVFCVSIRKTVAGYAALLGALDMLVFAGGIGERSAIVRSDVCRGLEFVGFAIDDVRNQANEGSISTGAVKVCIARSEEDRQIARHCRRMMRGS